MTRSQVASHVAVLHTRGHNTLQVQETAMFTCFLSGPAGHCVYQRMRYPTGAGCPLESASGAHPVWCVMPGMFCLGILASFC